MQKILYFSLICVACFQACGQKVQAPESSPPVSTDTSAPQPDAPAPPPSKPRINPEGKTLATRILPPSGFTRSEVAESSYAAYLRQLPLKPHLSEVKLYNGGIKPNNGIYDAVVDLEIGTKNLHQCADAVMRLRAEYLWGQKRFDDIHFNFTNGFRVDYAEWMAGKRVVVKGNSTYWKQSTSPSNTYPDFWKYLETIFNYAGTLSLAKELEAVELTDIQIGDVFIQGGSPGHAVLVVDMAEDTARGEKIFMLAQSYMPAQEIQILKNPQDAGLSPWYAMNFGPQLITPEWTFERGDLKRFEE